MREQFDWMMKRALEEKAREIEPSAQMLAEIKREAAARRKENGYQMKFGMKKLAAVAAVCLLSVTCYAASQLSGVQSHSTVDITTIEGMKKAEKKLDFDAKYVEKFANGMTFQRGGIGEKEGIDEEGNPMGKTYQMLTASYVDADGRQVTLSAEEGDHYVDAGQEVEMGYIADTYKFVPTDYEKTAEDLEKEAAGELHISYGTDEVEINEMEYYGWVDDGVYYALVGFDCGFGEAEMAQMADEVKAE